MDGTPLAKSSTAGGTRCSERNAPSTLCRFQMEIWWFREVRADPKFGNSNNGSSWFFREGEMKNLVAAERHGTHNDKLPTTPTVFTRLASTFDHRKARRGRRSIDPIYR